MKDKLKEIIADINPFVDINDDTDLIEEGVLDSLGIMALIEELESEFQIKIDMETIEIIDFKNIESIMSLLGRD